VKGKFNEIIKKHKLKFQMDFKGAIPYPSEKSLSYDIFIKDCESNKVKIAVVLGPPPDGPLDEMTFQQKLQETLDTPKISLQLISWQELDKDYRYLNLALDMTLIRYKYK